MLVAAFARKWIAREVCKAASCSHPFVFYLHLMQKAIFLIVLLTALTQCTTPDPYTPQQEQWRSDMREQDREQSSRAYQLGIQDGRMDFANGEANNYRRHLARYTPSTERAYADGYGEGYQSGAADGGASVTEPFRDAAYNQGYDYGVRDRVRGKPSDPDAYWGTYDARQQPSFTRGYQDGYNR
jgi:hypothetical protein